MNDYHTAVVLLGLRDSNMPVFKETRARRLESIDKIRKLINVLPRLKPLVPPNLLVLDENDPEWDDKMVYPAFNWRKLWGGLTWWGLITTFYTYNWNVIHTNIRLRFLGYLYPFLSAFFLSNSALYYINSMKKIRLFDNYVDARAQELYEQNRFMINHESVKRTLYFEKDFEETLRRVHRQANNHHASDFKDSELILQDFIQRYSNPQNPDAVLFSPTGALKCWIFLLIMEKTF